MQRGGTAAQRDERYALRVNPFPLPGYVPVLDMSTWRTAPASARRVDIAVTQDLVDV